jgi:type IV pilus assembly protein PilB
MPSLKDRLSEIFINNKLITKSQLDQALRVQAKRGGNLGDIIAELKLIKQARLSDTVNKILGLPLLDLKELKIDPEVIKIIPAEVARHHQIIPLSKEANTLTLAMADPLNIFAIHGLQELRGLKLNPVISSSQDISQVIALYYPFSFKVDIEELTRHLNAPIEIIKQEKEVSFSGQELERICREASVIKATNLVLEEAIKHKASEVLVEPFEKELRLRFRIGGLLKEQDVLAKDLHLSIVSRIKFISGLDIAERNLFQHTSLKTNILGRQIDLDISILPTNYGERVVLRILDKRQSDLDITELGFNDYAMGVLNRAVHLNHGMILVCGPHACGKTTTLYAILKSLNSLDKNIVTIEDSLEFQVEGVNQVIVNPEIGFSFAAGIRSILLQDPNIIMIGQIPDYETVDIAIKSALTGHLVFSTLQTATAAGAVSQLINMGIEPYLINSALVCVVAQRLLRKICPYCKEAYTLNKEVAVSLELDKHKINKLQFYRGKGCQHCSNTGYLGKIMIAEVLQFSQKIHELILSGAEEQLIKKQAHLEGMQTLRQAGLEAVLRGQTTIEEVLCVCAPDA